MTDNPRRSQLIDDAVSDCLSDPATSTEGYPGNELAKLLDIPLTAEEVEFLGKNIFDRVVQVD